MEYVSLLPPEIRLKRQEIKRRALFIRIGVVIFLVFLIIYAFLLISTMLARSDLNSLRSEKQLIETQIATLSEYEILYNDVNQAEAKVNQAMGTVTEWHKFFDDFALTLPPGVWLADLTANYDTEEGSLNISGWGFNHANVTDMLNRIEKIESLKDVRIRTSSETAYDGRDAVQFTIDAQLLPGLPYFELEEVEPETEEPVEEDS